MPAPRRRLAVTVVCVAALLGCDCAKRPASRTGAGPAFPTMTCDDELAGESFVELPRGHFRFHVLPHTAAERDLDEIARRREDAFARITAALHVDEPRVVDLYLSPGRAAARAHGRGVGVTWPAEARIEVLYLDAPDTFERRSIGHELTHVIAHQLDPTGRGHLKLVEEGLAERLDQSGRDLHLAFAQDLRASGRPLDEALRLQLEDATEPAYGKAGSFVTRLFELDPSVERFTAFYRELAMTWRGDEPLSAGGAPLDLATFEGSVDAALRKHYGLGEAEFTAGWRSALSPLLARPPVSVDAADRARIEALLAARDAAIGAADAVAYRATMEGFACDRTTEAEREREAARAADGVPTRSTIDEIVDLGISNFRRAAVHLREERAGVVRRRTAWLERYPVGWRVVRVK